MQDKRSNWVGLLSFGFFILLFALFFIIVPDYSSKVTDFFKDFELVEISSNFYFPAPLHRHPVVYETVMRFCIVFGFFQFFVLALRFFFRSSVEKTAETISNIIIWFGAAYMFFILMENNVDFWFPFIGGLIAVLGFSIVGRSLIVLLFHIYTD